MTLTETEYKRLVGYSGSICRDHSIKKDLVHDAWISYQLYSEPLDGEDKLKLLQFKIKQAFIRRNCRQDKTGKYVKKQMFYTNKIEALDAGFEYQPEMVSVSSLEPITQYFSRLGDKVKRYSQVAFKSVGIQRIKQRERNGRKRDKSSDRSEQAS